MFAKPNKIKAIKKRSRYFTVSSNKTFFAKGKYTDCFLYSQVFTIKKRKKMETMIATDLTTKTLGKVKYNFHNWVSEFPHTGVSDYVFDEINLRVFVEFEPFYFRQLEIKAIEILDAEYEVIDTDNALELRRYIRQTVEDFNHHPV